MTTLTDEELGTTSGTTTYADTDQVYRGTFEGRLVGTATSAKQLETPFKLELQGDVAGNVDISGKQGVILRTKVSHATEADRADFAGNTALAANANYADLANLANFAVESGKAEEAEYSKESNHAKESDHSLTADRADIADKALLSDRATIADRAYKADSANKDNKGNVIDETYAVDKDLIHKDEYLTNAIIQGLATGKGTIDETTLIITIDKIASGGLTIFEFAPFPTTEADRDTTKIYVSQANKQFYIFNTETSKWENLFDTYSVAINNLATKLNTDLNSTKTELQNTINSNKTATDKSISGLEKNLKILIQNNKDYAENRYVKKSGDTLTSSLNFTCNDIITRTSDNGLINIFGGTAQDKGAVIQLRGKDNSAGGGVFYLGVNNDTNSSHMFAEPNGSITWNNKNLVRSVNGTNADSTGNVSITTIANATNATKATQDASGNVITNTYVKKSGDTLTGALKSSYETFVIKNDNKGALNFYGGSAWNTGSSLSLFGEESNLGNQFALCCKSGNTQKNLIGTIGGVLTWCNKNIVLSVNNTKANSAGNVTLDISTSKFMPDYANGINLSLKSTYTAPCDGYVVLNSAGGSGQRSQINLKISDASGNVVYRLSNGVHQNAVEVNSDACITTLLPKGYKCYADSNLKNATYKFFPLKGAN